jgi:DNA polymerase-3 subunit alpha/error-prone DNA polymerase
MALTDINTVTGIYDFIKECQAVAIKPSGIDLIHKLLYIGLAKKASVLPK